ncbi:MAG: S8 family serine peptidase [Bacteroidota bacterium]
MKFALYIKSFLRLSCLIIVILTWPACDPDMPPAPTCDDDVPTVNLVDEACVEGTLLDFNNLIEPQGGVLPLIANFCATDYSRSRLFRMPIQEDVSLAIYANFPGDVLVEVIGSNCEGNLPFLIECITVESVAEIVPINVGSSGAEDILIRVVPQQTGEYDPGINPEDEISVLAYGDIGNPQTFNDIIIGCSGDRLQRLVISGPSGIGFDAAASLGLPVSESCNCSDGDLLAVDVPYGVDLLTLTPKAKTRVSRALNDTTGLGIDFDFLVNIPPITQIGYDPQDDVYINSSEAEPCFTLQEPGASSPSSPEQGVTVAFVDSGYDILNWADPFVSSVAYQGQTPMCLQDAGFNFTQYGFNLLNPGSSIQDDSGHGTDVASTFVSNINDVPISALHFKFFNDQSGSYFDALCASYIAVQAGTNLINWSWGFYESEFPKSLSNLLEFMQSSNVLAVAAAGNEMANINSEPLFPAAASTSFDNVIAVGSYIYPTLGDYSPELAAFSNFSNIRVNVAAYATKETPLAGTFDLHKPAGTSISTPLVTKELAEFWGAQIDMGNANISYTEVVGSVFGALPIDAPLLLDFIEDGRYLPVGCEDGDLPDP